MADSNGNLKLSHFLTIMAIVSTIAIAVNGIIYQALANETKCRIESVNNLSNRHDSDYRELSKLISRVENLQVKIATKLNVEVN